MYGSAHLRMTGWRASTLAKLARGGSRRVDQLAIVVRRAASHYFDEHLLLQIPRGSSGQGARHLIRHGEVKVLNILWDLTLFRHPQPCALNRAIDRTPLVLSKSLPRPEAASISCGVSCRKCKLKSHLPSKFRARFVCYICTRIGTRTELTTMGALGWTTTAHYPGPTISSAPQYVQPPKKETPLVAIRVASWKFALVL